MEEMTLKKIIAYATNELCEQYEEKEAKAIVLRLLADSYDVETTELSLYFSDKLDTHFLEKLKKDINRLKKNEPIQYVTGKTYFDDLVLKIRKPILIPRPETEELFYKIADIIEKEYDKEKELRILDIGTGSGCLALALKKHFTNAKVLAVDIDEEAIVLTKENASNLGLSIDVKQLDIMNEIPEGKYDIIVSNPPYVRESEKEFMHANVLQYESEKALFVADDNALSFYQRIAELATKNLKKGGCVFLEINEVLGKQTQTLYLKAGYEKILLEKDFRGKDRFLFLIKLF